MQMRRESARSAGGARARHWARLAALPALPLMLAAAPAAPHADDDILAERLRTAPSSRLALDVDWFKPLAKLPPAAAPLALAPAPDNGARFAGAVALAEAARSTALLVWHDGALRLEHYGPGADAATRTQSQSMHKSVLAMMVALAFEDGHLASIEAPVSDYLGNWTPQPLGLIRIRHLLEMASGLALPPPGETGPDAFAVRLFHGTEIASVAREAVQVKPPGTVFEYNNVNPQLLLAVLEAATGMAYEDYLARRLWGRIAEAPGGLWMDRAGGTPHGYCCLTGANLGAFSTDLSQSNRAFFCRDFPDWDDQPPLFTAAGKFNGDFPFFGGVSPAIATTLPVELEDRGGLEAPDGLGGKYSVWRANVSADYTLPNDATISALVSRGDSNNYNIGDAFFGSPSTLGAILFGFIRWTRDSFAEVRYTSADTGKLRYMLGFSYYKQDIEASIRASEVSISRRTSRRPRGCA